MFHHFSQWSKKGAWQKAWEALLAAHKDYLDMSSIQIDGTHTPARGGGQAVGYQGRKSSMTTNLLCISDSNGVLSTWTVKSVIFKLWYETRFKIKHSFGQKTQKVI